MKEKMDRAWVLRQSLADNIAMHRKRLELSQEAFADFVGLHRTYIGHLENCRHAPNLDSVEKLAEALGVAPHEMLLPNPSAKVTSAASTRTATKVASPIGGGKQPATFAATAAKAARVPKMTSEAASKPSRTSPKATAPRSRKGA